VAGAAGNCSRAIANPLIMSITKFFQWRKL